MLASQSQTIKTSLMLNSASVPFEVLEEAFGPDSLGILIVRDLPARFLELRLKLLSYGSYLANLPAEELGRLPSPYRITYPVCHFHLPSPEIRAEALPMCSYYFRDLIMSRSFILDRLESWPRSSQEWLL